LVSFETSQPSSPTTNAEPTADEEGLPVRGFYKIAELARAAGMTRWRIVRLLKHFGVELHSPSKVALVPLHELETKAKPLCPPADLLRSSRRLSRARPHDCSAFHTKRPSDRRTSEVCSFESRSQYSAPYAFASIARATAGIVLALMAEGQGFSITALMGILMVIGIAVSNGILLVDDANHRLTREGRRRGRHRRGGALSVRPHHDDQPRHGDRPRPHGARPREGVGGQSAPRAVGC
jgi:hypothetical protein